MRTLLCLIAALALVAPASAGNLDLGEAIPWAAGWGDPAGVVDNGDGTISASINNGSAGVFWRLPAEASETISIEGAWTGTTGAAGWAEVMMFTCTVGMSDGDIAARIDNGSVAPDDIRVKKDSWGLNPPNPWGWEDIAASALAPLEIHATCDEVIVALKVGHSGSGGPTQATFDLTYVPEPAAALLLGLPMLLIRRRR